MVVLHSPHTNSYESGSKEAQSQFCVVQKVGLYCVVRMRREERRRGGGEERRRGEDEERMR